MHKFNEDLLQLIWQHKLIQPAPLITTSGQEIFILKTGDFNKDAGPDFFNARIRVNDIELVGSVEIHIKTSDWIKHGHQYNKGYNTIILHVVYEHDANIPQNLEHNVEVLELKPLIADKTFEIYEQLLATRDRLPCSGQLHRVNDLKFVSWMQRMAIERLEEKVKRLEQIFAESKGDYTQVLYTSLLRNFGFKVNAIPFELIARHLPLKILLKHADNLLQLESLLLGVSGLLDNQYHDKYIQTLQNEFEFLKTKYHLQPLQKEIFKFSKLRPANFPNLRLAQFATLFHNASAIITQPQAVASLVQLKTALKIKTQGYWKNHYTLGGKLLEKELALGDSSIENIIINTFAPFFFFYSKKMGDASFSELAMDVLMKCSFESNTKTRLFDAKKELLKNSADSQAIINLHDNYCMKKRCLHCGIAMELLKTG